MNLKYCKYCFYDKDANTFESLMCQDCYKKRRAENYQRDNDPAYKLKVNFSGAIRRVLKQKNGSKAGDSFLKYLNYTIQELKQHLESQFEPWMNWENHGNYRVAEWDDNDQSTWKWNIDHIIPCDAFYYTSMEDEEFKRCWALENLRPLNAKCNLIKGKY